MFLVSILLLNKRCYSFNWGPIFESLLIVLLKLLWVQLANWTLKIFFLLPLSHKYFCRTLKRKKLKFLEIAKCSWLANIRSKSGDPPFPRKHCFIFRINFRVFTFSMDDGIFAFFVNQNDSTSTFLYSGLMVALGLKHGPNPLN